MTRCTTRCTSSRLTYQLKYKRCYRLKKIVPWETQLQFSKVRPLLGFSTPFFHFIIFYISSFLDCGHCLGLHHLASTSSFSIFPSSQIHNFLPHVCLIVLTLNGMAKFFTIWTSFVSEVKEHNGMLEQIWGFEAGGSSWEKCLRFRMNIGVAKNSRLTSWWCSGKCRLCVKRHWNVPSEVHDCLPNFPMISFMMCDADILDKHLVKVKSVCPLWPRIWRQWKGEDAWFRHRL